MSDIFISYAKEDRTQAERLAQALEKQHWSVWWDKSIPAGGAFAEVIEEALEAARCVIVLWSERSVASRWVRNEAEEGANRHILVPIRIEDVKIPLQFRSIQTADLIGWEGAPGAPEIEALVADIGPLLDRLPEGQQASERPADVLTKLRAAGGLGQQAGDEVAREGGARKSRWQENLFFAAAALVVAFGLWGILDLPDDSSRSLALLGVVLGICILGFCLWAYLRSPSTASTSLAASGLCLSLGNLVVTESLPSNLLRLVAALVIPLMLAGHAFLVHFLLLFPKRRPFLDNSWGVKVVFFPVAVVALLYVSLPFPELHPVKLLTLTVYYIWAALLVMQSFTRASSRERSEQGLGLMLIAVILGLLPSIVGLMDDFLRTEVALPGRNYYDFPLGLMPIMFAIAILRAHKTKIAAGRS